MVSTAHIHWDPEFSDVKLIQTMMLVNELKKITEETIQSYKLGTTDVNSIPLIMCGDLNSLPDSGIHKTNINYTTNQLCKTLMGSQGLLKNIVDYTTHY